MKLNKRTQRFMDSFMMNIRQLQSIIADLDRQLEDENSSPEHLANVRAVREQAQGQIDTLEAQLQEAIAQANQQKEQFDRTIWRTRKAIASRKRKGFG